MLGETVKEITSLLKKIVVFEIEFKEEILQKLASLDEHKLLQLKNILLETEEWQTKFLQQKISADPNFYNKVMDAKQKARRAVMEVYRRKFEKEDHEKMEIILNKIKSL